MQTMDKKCLPVFKYFRSQRKSKVLVHGFGDSAEDSLMFPLLKDGNYTYLYNTSINNSNTLITDTQILHH